MKRVVTMIVLFGALLTAGGRVFAGTPNPTLTGPISGGSHGQAFGAMDPQTLADAGYIESEYFFNGTATSYSRVDVSDNASSKLSAASTT